MKPLFSYLLSIAACTAVANALGRPFWSFLCDWLSFNASRMTIFLFIRQATLLQRTWQRDTANSLTRIQQHVSIA